MLASFGRDEQSLVCLDDFFAPARMRQAEHPDIPPGVLDFEQPSGIDFDACLQAVQARAAEQGLVIVEGFLLFHDPRLFELCTQRIFIHIDFETAMRRRCERGRCYTARPYFWTYAEAIIWPSYLQHNHEFIADGNANACESGAWFDSEKGILHVDGAYATSDLLGQAMAMFN